MNVIIAYLVAMFSAYPQTPRLLEAKAELQGMMEDAYTGLIAEGRSENEAVGQVIRDFGNLDDLAPMLGITSDITPVATGASAPVAATERLVPASPQNSPGHLSVTLKEAQGFADAHQRTRFHVSIAVMLFVLSPTVLIALPAAARAGIVSMSPDVATFIGLLTLLVLVAVGVALMVIASRATEPYARISDGRFTADPAVIHWAEALAEQHSRGRSRALVVAVALWILSPIPLIAFSLLLDGSPQIEFWNTIGVVLVLVIVATGLGILLPQAWAHTVAERLTHRAAGCERGASPDGDERSIVGVIAAFYWPLLTAIYLAWSFIGNDWGISWIVWPIGGVIFGAIAGGGHAVESYRRAQRQDLAD